MAAGAFSRSACLAAVIAGLFSMTLLCGCTKAEKNITCLQDAQHASIGVLTGSTGERAAISRCPQARISRFDGFPDAVVALNAEKIDAMVASHTTGVKILRTNPRLRLLPERLFEGHLAIAVKKGNADRLAKLNRAIDGLKSDGTLSQLEERWILADQLPSEPLDIPVIQEGASLRIGVTGAQEPFSFIDSTGQVNGHDVELSRFIGARLHRPVQFVTMKFMALIPALKAGKIDLILSNMTETEERSKSVDFTHAYLTDAQMMIVRKPEVAAKIHIPFLSSIVEGFKSNLLRENRYLLILNGLKITVIISILSTLIGTVLGAGICLMRMSGKWFLVLPARIYIAIVRGTPVLVTLMITFYVIFASVNISPVAVSVIAFALNFGAYSAEIFRSGIEGIPRGQSEAGIAMGFSRIGTFRHIILPQTARRILPVYNGEFISLVKMTSIVGYVAVQDLTKASDIIRSRTFDAFFPLLLVAVLYFLISWGVIHAVEYLERISDPRTKRAKAVRS